MPTAVIPFQDLAQRIQQQEAELAKLRQELQQRQSRLTALMRRKEELQEALRSVDAELESVGQVHAPEPVTPAAPVRKAKPAAAKPASKRGKGMSLPHYLVKLVEEANKPITVKELTDQLVQRKFPTTCKDFQ